METFSCAATLMCTSSVSTPAKVFTENQATVEVTMESRVRMATNTIILLRLLWGTFSLTMRSTARENSPIANTPSSILVYLFRKRIFSYECTKKCEGFVHVS